MLSQTDATVRQRALRGLPHEGRREALGSHSLRNGLYRYRTSGASRAGGGTLQSSKCHQVAGMHARASGGHQCIISGCSMEAPGPTAYAVGCTNIAPPVLSGRDSQNGAKLKLSPSCRDARSCIRRQSMICQRLLHGAALLFSGSATSDTAAAPQKNRHPGWAG